MTFVSGAREEIEAMAAKRLQLSTMIQSSFGKPDDPDYVFDIVAK